MRLKMLLCFVVVAIVGYAVYMYYESSKSDHYVNISSFPMDDTATIQYADGNIEYIEDANTLSPGFGMGEQIVGSSRIMSSLGA